jgi:chorismate-pyruvate lyase
VTFAPGIPDFPIASLDLLQRILVSTDGTVTDVLSVAFLEPIDLVKLHIAIEEIADAVADLDLESGATVMRRRIVLRGRSTMRPYAYAEATIAIDHLGPALRRELLEGVVPLGQLWQSHRLETWKERPRVRQQAAADVAACLDLRPADPVIVRTYRTFTAGRPVFAVTEYFPVTYRPA